jgi:hypothetical protein
MYLRSAVWGFDTLLRERLSGYGFRFHMIGILASLRAVQHALDAHDKELSPEHRIDWMKSGAILNATYAGLLSGVIRSSR